MENLKHTKGEWFANNCTVTIQGTFDEIARCYSNDARKQATQDYDEMRANAKLIAAAPDLLEALNNLVNKFSSARQVKELGIESELNNAINAINKATK